MTQEVLDFIIELEQVFQERSYLTSKRDMLGGKNREAEKAKTMIAAFLLTIIEQWYTTEFTADYLCEETDIQHAVDCFNAICKSNVYLNSTTTYSSSVGGVWGGTGDFWNDDNIWNDDNVWND